MPKNKFLEKAVVDVIKTCYDPELPTDIYELGLIYNLQVKPSGLVKVIMTLTSPTCPVAETLPVEVEKKIKKIPGVSEVKLRIVWDPPWTPERMSEAAKLACGMM